MITGKDIYNVLAAVAPLYVAMALAYGSVKRWKIFTPDQCAGINRFVAVFAVPFLAFHFISTNNLYAMNYRFLAADALQKVVILVVLFLVKAITKHVGLEWIISSFSLATLPNTLVMGIPLLKGMYGEFTASLMVQIVVLQSVIWYNLMLFMFEYRGAMILIAEQFPETAGAISSITVDSDVVSLSGRDPLQADAVIGDDGRLHVSLRRLISSSPSLSSFNKAHTLNSITPRASNLTGVEIFSVHSSKEPTPRGSNFNQTDDQAVFPSPKHGLVNSFQKALGDYYGSTQSSRISTPRDSFHFEEENLKICQKNVSGSLHCHQHHLPGAASRSLRKNKELHMFVWSSAASSSMSDGHQSHSVNGNTAAFAEIEVAESAKSLRHESEKAADEAHGSSKKNQMPPATVMTRLILIMVWRKLITNPNTYASVFGLVWSLISFRWNVQMPSIVKGSISILSDTGLGMAMFSLGLFMALQPKIIACGKTVASLAMAVRFLIGPAVIAGTSFAVGLRGPLLHVSIIQAALPQGIVPFVFAKEYNVHAYVLSTAVIFGMLVALPITLIYYVLLEL